MTNNAYNSSSRRKAVKAITLIILCFSFTLFIRSYNNDVGDGNGIQGTIQGKFYPTSVSEPEEGKKNVGNNEIDSTTTRLPEEISEAKKEREMYELKESVWTYSCIKDVGCVRQLRVNNTEEPMEFEVCWLNCGDFGALWPYPTGNVTLGKCVVPFKLQNLEFAINKRDSSLNDEAVQILKGMQDVFMLKLRKLVVGEQDSLDDVRNIDKEGDGHMNTILIGISVANSGIQINLDTSEAYSLSISSGDEQSCQTQIQKEDTKVHVSIKAGTIFGVRHALESLFQLMAFDSLRNCFQVVNNAEIKDGPEFPYRGILLDTARNFMPVQDLKRFIDAMSYNKLNVFHWHLSDSNAFPFYSKRVPQMTQYGAYSKDKIYYPAEVKEILQYARIRGIKIIPELDAPAHAGNGWQWGPSAGLGNLSLCINKDPYSMYCGQPPCGQLNPVNVNTFVILGKIYKDMLELFDNDIFHMGGDEVYFQCWESEPQVAEWIKNGEKIDMIEVWGFFQEEAFKRLKEGNNNKSIRPILWTSGLTKSPPGRKFLNSSDYIIQFWESGSSPDLGDLLRANYQLIISNVDKMYLDHGAGTWLGTAHIYEYKLWQMYYDNKLSQFHPNLKQDKQLPPSKRQILGGEVALWAEKVNAQSMDTRLWPRAASFAENVWSDPPKRTPFVYSRLNFHNRRMIQLGIRSDQLQPESCLLLTGHCDDIASHI